MTVLLFNKYIVCFDLFFTFAAEKVIDVCFHRHVNIVRFLLGHVAWSSCLVKNNE